MIKIENISKSYKKLQVLKNINLHIQKGEVLAIVGASGAGKSTLLHIIGTLDRPDVGNVLFNDQNITQLSEKALSMLRNNKIGFIFQFHNLLPEFTALENVCLPAWIGKKDDQVTRERAKMLLEMLNLGERTNHFPSQLSGGEQQRVAVARALINSPDIVLADEPSGNLDSKNAQELHHIFFDLREKFNQTFVIVTHNETLAKMADRTIVLQDGNII